MGKPQTRKQKLFSAFMRAHMIKVLREWIADCKSKGVCWVCRLKSCEGSKGNTFEAHWGPMAPQPGAREWYTLVIVKGRK
jgi:hypothetical protein